MLKGVLHSTLFGNLSVSMIVDIDKLDELKQKNSQKKIGLAAGTFDLLHTGHLQYLNWAKKHCDILVVYIRSDTRVSEAKNRTPYNNEEDRALLVDSIKAVDFTVIGKEISTNTKPSIEIALLLKADVIFIGSGWGSEKVMWRKNLPEAEILLSPTPHIKSSTQTLIDNKLLDN